MKSIMSYLMMIYIFVQVQPKPTKSKYRTCLAKQKSISSPASNFLLTQNSPPPKQLFSATKQSSLTQFFKPAGSYGKLACLFDYLSQLIRLWHLSHRRSAKAQASLRIRAVLPEPSLFANMKYGSRRRVRPNI